MDKPNAGMVVDGFCRGNPGRGGYRGLNLETGEQLFYCDDLKNTTNNVAEFIALVHGLGFSKIEGKIDNKNYYPVIYTDSQSAIAWFNKKDASTDYAKLCEVTKQKLDRCLRWLSEQKSLPMVKKWETKLWGEIPADFGNKVKLEFPRK